MISQSALLLIGLVYLGALFLIAYATDRGFIPKKIVDHPLVFVLSLGVFAGSWAIYGAVGFSNESGYNYLAFYLGLSAAYFFSPVLLSPIFQLSKNYQLNSLADLLAFRYRSPLIGKLVTIFLIISITPLLAAQIQAVASSIQYITKDGSKDELAIIFCVFITLFTIVFGAQHFDNKNTSHRGLVLAIAIESLFKLIAILIIAGFCIYVVFDGHDAMHTWLRNNPSRLTNMYEPMINGNWPTLVLIFFAASFAMPHMYHMAFVENQNQKSLYIASWGLPLYLFLMAISIPPILWAGQKLFPSNDIAFDYVAIGISLVKEAPIIGLLAYLAGVSAASGIVIVSTLALASMSLNHLITLKHSTESSGTQLYSWLRLQKNILIAVIIASSYVVYRFIDNQQTLSQLIILAYTASVQFLPAVFCTLFWKPANRQGVFMGILAGFAVWMLAFYLPLLIELDPLGLFHMVGIEISYIGVQLNNRDWHFVTMYSIVINAMVMAFVSLITPTREDEKLAAEQCTQNMLSPRRYRQLDISHAHEFSLRLARPLGKEVAEKEVRSAMNELGLKENESRPFFLQKLRHRIETNLSRLLGPTRAREILNEHIPVSGDFAESDDLYAMEGRLEEYQYRLTGLAAELNNLRKFHRQTLLDLPIGVCALAQDEEIVTWNHSIEGITELKSESVVGSKLQNVPEPWGSLFKEFILSNDTHWHRKKITLNHETRWLNLHKANISDNRDKHTGDELATNVGLALLVDDVSNLLKLEAKLTHSERLASVGRMAAGVAHEIGNPITGIDCLAQNMLFDLKHAEPNELAEDTTEMLDEIRVQTKRVSTIVQSLMGFSRAGQADRESIPVSLNYCIEEAKKLLLLGSHEKNIEIRNRVEPRDTVLGDEQLLIQVFVNLLANAIDASENNSCIEIKNHRHGEHLHIQIVDYGEGIPEQLLPTIFDPFVTSKDPGKGTGLGLSLVHSIVEDHGGTITIDNWSRSEKGEMLSGTQVDIRLPILVGDSIETNPEN